MCGILTLCCDVALETDETDLPTGQSNMQWAMQSTEHVGEEIPAANHPTLRLFQIDTVVAPQPLDDVQHR